MNELFRALVENSSDMVSVVGPDGTLCFHYPPDVLGYDEGENFGRSVLDFIHPDDLEQAMARLAAVRGTSDVSLPFEFRLRRADGSWRWVEAVGRDLTDERDIGGVVINSRDITERKRAEELERRARALAESNRELEEFAYVASHDLAGPLRLIEAHARAVLASELDVLSAEGRRGLEVIVTRAGRMQELIDDLLACAKVGAGSTAEPVDLNWAVDKGAAEAGLRVHSDALPRVLGDRVQLVQLFANVLGNAAKFRHPERPLEVRVWARNDRDMWTVGVDDNGIGIPAPDRRRVFRMFERLGAPSAAPGTGIGLALCARIAERHGGRIWVEDGIGGGTGVRISFPTTA